MKETRVPYKPQMIRAILAGRKWQTRRIAKGEPAPGGYRIGDMLQGQGGKPIKSPYGLPGDLMVATEAWRVSPEFDHLPPSQIQPGTWVYYDADGARVDGDGRYRPGMFMPRWASRIESVITDVRVERLLEISEADALAEGIERYNGPLRWVKYVNPMNPDKVYHSAAAAYLGLWESINGPDTAMMNPWVWAYSFTPRKQP